jgi:triosephosphate isomerase
MRKFILAANWKMNLTAAEAQDWLTQFNDLVTENSTHEFRLYAPSLFSAELAKSNTIHIGAQNAFPSDFGAFTGEVSIPQLISVGVKSLLIGHSERRSYFHESTEFIKKKVDACCQHAFPFILCCGEDFETREKDEYLSFIRNQLSTAIEQVEKEQLALMVIAYEPIWAIGTGQTATIDQILEVHGYIRSVLIDFFGELGVAVPILYGGSVNSSNAKSIFACPEVNGGLIGGASLNASVFLELASSL